MTSSHIPLRVMSKMVMCSCAQYELQHGVVERARRLHGGINIQRIGLINTSNWNSVWFSNVLKRWCHDAVYMDYLLST